MTDRRSDYPACWLILCTDRVSGQKYWHHEGPFDSCASAITWCRMHRDKCKVPRLLPSMVPVKMEPVR